MGLIRRGINLYFKVIFKKGKEMKRYVLLISFLIFGLFTISYSQTIVDLNINSVQDPITLLRGVPVYGEHNSPTIECLENGTILNICSRSSDFDTIRATMINRNGDILYKSAKYGFINQSNDNYGRMASNKKDLFAYLRSPFISSSSKLLMDVIDSNGTVLVDNFEIISDNENLLDPLSINFISSKNIIVIYQTLEGPFESTTYSINVNFSTGEVSEPKLLINDSYSIHRFVTFFNNDQLKYIYYRYDNNKIYGNILYEDSLLYEEPKALLENIYPEGDKIYLSLNGDNEYTYIVYNYFSEENRNTDVYKFNDNLSQFINKNTLDFNFHNFHFKTKLFINDSFYFTFTIKENDSLKVYYGKTNSNFDLIGDYKLLASGLNNNQNLDPGYSDVDFTGTEFAVAYKNNLPVFQRLVDLDGNTLVEAVADEYYKYIDLPKVENVAFRDDGASMMFYSRNNGKESKPFASFIDKDGFEDNPPIEFLEDFNKDTLLSYFNGEFISDSLVVAVWNEHIESQGNWAKIGLINIYTNNLVKSLTLTEESLYDTKPIVKVLTDSVVAITCTYFSSNKQAYFYSYNVYSNSLGTPVLIDNQDNYSGEIFPYTAIDENGAGCVFWTDLSTDGTDTSKILARRFSSKGEFLDNYPYTFYSNDEGLKIKLASVEYGEESELFFSTIENKTQLFLRNFNNNGELQREPINIYSHNSNFNYLNNFISSSYSGGNGLFSFKEYLNEQFNIILATNDELYFVKKYFIINDNDIPVNGSFSKIIGNKVYSFANVGITDKFDITSSVQFRVDSFSVVTSTSVVKDDNTPENFFMLSNYPNPFNPETTIRFNLPDAGNAKLTVYNVLGEQVANLVNRELEAGQHNVKFNAANLASGVYIARLDFDSGSQAMNKTIKMLVLK